MATGNGSRQLRRYNVRTDRGTWLGEFVISDDGLFATVSDYGNYAYAWTHAGMEFRAFLASLGTDYLLGKLCGRPSTYQPEKTLKHVKQYICESRRDGSFSKEEARKEWDLLADNSDLDAAEDFSRWLEDTSIGDAFEMSCRDYDGNQKGFASTVWPAFVAILRTELTTEQAAPS